MHYCCYHKSRQGIHQLKVYTFDVLEESHPMEELVPATT